LDEKDSLKIEPRILYAFDGFQRQWDPRDQGEVCTRCNHCVWAEVFFHMSNIFSQIRNITRMCNNRKVSWIR
jgi:hypothetical protein